MKHILQISIVILLAIIPLLSCEAQEMLSKEERERKIPPGVEVPEHRVIEAKPRLLKSYNVCPPNWWVGMHYNEVEILIHDNQIGNARVEIDYPGITVLHTDRVENPNYLFVEVRIDPETKPGTADIELFLGSSVKQYRFEIKERQSRKGRIDGLNSGDFIYLLMPDRFANGDYSNDVVDGMNQNEIDRRRMYYRHGGDIDGIIQKLDYLQELGVTALWPNPLDENDQPYESYHGYAPTAHYQVDPRFGSNEDYIRLGSLLEERKMKLVKDVVFNHVGDHHWFIRDLPSRDWIHQFESFTKTTYRAPVHTDPYVSKKDKMLMTEGWFDHHMPDMNFDNPHVARFFIQNSLWWIEYAGVDAYRVDTYAYPEQRFMGEWASHIRREYPNFALFAETWVHGMGIQSQFTEDSPMREWNNHMPATTDFQVYYAINESLTQEQGWTSGVARLYYTLAQDRIYENPYDHVLFLDNHDLSRFYSVIGEDIRKFKSGINLLLTLRGIPSMYYGTEILMKNFTDPDGKVRQDFPGGWDDDEVNKFNSEGRTDVENEAFNHIKKLANYRLQHSVLHDGKMMQFVPRDGVYVYFRYNEDETVMVVLNSHESTAELELSRFRERILGYSEGVDIQTKEVYDLSESINLEGYTSLVLELRK